MRRIAIGDDQGSAAAAHYAGAAGYSEGSVGIDISGSGTLVLSAANTFTGGTTLAGGTLDLAHAGAAGSGSITFSTGADATLKIESGNTPANLIDGFTLGETIDLAGTRRRGVAGVPGRQRGRPAGGSQRRNHRAVTGDARRKQRIDQAGDVAALAVPDGQRANAADGRTGCRA
jgi:autotransporter-associated beta strand protein